MPKIKTKKAAQKRFKKRAHSFKRKHASHSHLLTGKTRKRKRQLRKSAVVSKSDTKRIERLIPY
ncbi:50S ribosomal protein L35 [candidate division WOR-3 bacterium]|nr:50S ribosomal protein L35 [candidate division WOR-3 bacterium]